MYHSVASMDSLGIIWLVVVCLGNNNDLHFENCISKSCIASNDYMSVTSRIPQIKCLNMIMIYISEGDGQSEYEIASLRERWDKWDCQEKTTLSWEI